MDRLSTDYAMPWPPVVPVVRSAPLSTRIGGKACSRKPVNPSLRERPARGAQRSRGWRALGCPGLLALLRHEPREVRDHGRGRVLAEVRLSELPGHRRAHQDPRPKLTNFDQHRPFLAKMLPKSAKLGEFQPNDG